MNFYLCIVKNNQKIYFCGNYEKKIWKFEKKVLSLSSDLKINYKGRVIL